MPDRYPAGELGSTHEPDVALGFAAVLDSCPFVGLRLATTVHGDAQSDWTISRFGARCCWHLLLHGAWLLQTPHAWHGWAQDQAWKVFACRQLWCS